MSEKRRKNYIKVYLLPIIIIGLLTALDQLTKFIVVNNFMLNESKPIIKDVFSLTYIRNEGIAWGLFQGKRYLFLIITVIVLMLCFFVYHKIYSYKEFMPLRICLIFIISGSIGNMIDRIKLGYVIDFFDFELINFPVFNIADIYVTVTMIVMFILIGFVYKEEDIDKIFSKEDNDAKEEQQDNKI